MLREGATPFRQLPAASCKYGSLRLERPHTCACGGRPGLAARTGCGADERRWVTPLPESSIRRAPLTLGPRQSPVTTRPRQRGTIRHSCGGSMSRRGVCLARRLQGWGSGRAGGLGAAIHIPDPGGIRQNGNSPCFASRQQAVRGAPLHPKSLGYGQASPRRIASRFHKPVNADGLGARPHRFGACATMRGGEATATLGISRARISCSA